jgi:hypothetical protein
MSALTMAVCIWSMVAMCVVLFIHGAKAGGRPGRGRPDFDEVTDFSPEMGSAAVFTS